MTAIVMFLSLLFGTLLQSLWPPIDLVGQIKPPFLLAVVLYYALNRSGALMLCAAVLAGFLQDALTPIPLGYSSAVFVGVGWLCSRYRNLVIAESSVTPMVFGGLAAPFTMLALSLLLVHGGETEWVPLRLLLKLIGSGLLGAGTTWVVFMLSGGLERRVGNVRAVDEII